MSAQAGWTDPFWALAPLRGLSSDAWPEGRIDVIIVGAGLTGLVCGITAARLGLRVVILEAHFPGAGASGRNAGFITAGTTRSYDRCASLMGASKAAEVWRFSIDAAVQAVRYIEKERIDCAMARIGRVTLAVSPRHAEAQRRQAGQEQARFGWPLEVIARNDLDRVTGLSGFHGGLLDPLTWGVDPLRLVAGLVQAYRGAGGSIVFPAPVDAIEGTNRTASSITVRIGTRALGSRAGVVALDGFSDRLPSPWARRVFAVGSALLATEPMPREELRRLSPTGAAIETSETFKRYFRVLSDGRLLIGGRNSLLSPDRQPDAIRRLIDRSAAWLTPAGETLRVSHAWPCVLGFTMNMLPILARKGQWFFSGGYCGHGIPTSIALGRLAGLWLAGRETPRVVLHQIGHGTPPRALHQSFLAAATVAFRCRDWMATRGIV